MRYILIMMDKIFNNKSVLRNMVIYCLLLFFRFAGILSVYASGTLHTAGNLNLSNSAVIWVSLGLIAYILYVVRKRIVDRQMRIAQKIKEEQKDKLFQSKLNFFTNVIHEFCTPLAVIKGVSESIEKSTGTDENLKKYMTVLRDNVNNLNSLIQEILDFRRIEKGTQGFNTIERVPVSELVEKQVKWFIPIAERNNIRLDVSAPEALEWNTNVLGFNRVLINLISNAFKYTTEGGEVKVSIAENDGLLVLKVYNTGQGIEESKIASVFDRYRVLEDMEVNNAYSSMTSRNGLGLSICHEIVGLLKGCITVKSEVNRYTEFTVELPLPDVTDIKTESVDSMFPAEKGAVSMSDMKHDKKTVLVVDDHKDLVWLITTVLSDTYSVKNAYRAEDALAIIGMETPALIITDVMMPDIDGLEFIKRLKADKFTKHIPVVVVSAKISEKDQAEGLDMGADAYLTKPFSPAVLRSVINRLLTVKDELKEYYYSPESAYQYTEGHPMHQEDKAFMDSIVTIISENLESENLRPEFIADKLNTNTRSLYRRFKKHSNLSPSDFIKDYRFMSAAKLLITTNLTIQEIIYKVGITNKSYFYREFLKKYNMTPKEYRSHK